MRLPQTILTRPIFVTDEFVIALVKVKAVTLDNITSTFPKVLLEVGKPLSGVSILSNFLGNVENYKKWSSRTYWAEMLILILRFILFNSSFQLYFRPVLRKLIDERVVHNLREIYLNLF